MQSFKSILEWWRLIAATILVLPFVQWSLVIDKWLKSLPTHWLTVLVCILSVGFFLSGVYFLKIRSEHKLKLKYGIYWDKKKNSYCPYCQKPIVYDYADYAAKSYYCHPCQHRYYLVDVLGNRLEPENTLL